MLCWFLVYSKVIPLYTYIYLFFFRFFTYIGYYRVVTERALLKLRSEFNKKRWGTAYSF